MALIGTAFISTVRVDRYSATQNTYNTQVDLLSQGMFNLAEQSMYRKLTATTGVFRQVSGSGSTSTGIYHPWESPISDLYLADRTPSAVFAAVPLSANQPAMVPLGYTAGLPFSAINPVFSLWTPWDSKDVPSYNSQLIPAGFGTFPVWMHITAPLNATSTNPHGQFEAPYAVDWKGKTLQLPFTYTSRDQILPWAIPVPQGDGSTKLFPAFVINPSNPAPGSTSSTPPVVYLADGTTPATLPIVVLAADADGDGIADSGFIRIDGGQIEGATYYGAVRIIDNSAALNASIAMGINAYPPPGNAVPGDLFPSNIDLQTLVDPDTLSGLNAYRFNNNMSNFATAIDDTGATHTDFAFSTPYEALWTQLGCRLGNPGYINSTQTKYQALPVTEQMDLAYHFCLANPNVVSSGKTLLEGFPPHSVLGPRSVRGPYSPADLGTWFADQFVYNPDQSQNTALRASLVVHNPVSNFVPSWFNDQGTYGNPPLSGATSYSFGDRVQFPDPNISNVYGQQMRGFVCIQPHTVGSQAPMNGTAYNNAFWAAMPWANHPTKINANTGTFGQLWTAYWSVMQDSPDANGAYPGGTVKQADFDSNSSPATNNLSHQFRNPIRSTSALQLSRSQVIQLRSALAAVNTIDTRDGDTDITSRTIKLVDTAGNQPLYANVYGAERQPYFSAVLIDFEPNKPPYIVVELYNPHPVPIRMNGWKLACLTRSGGTISLKEVGDLTKTLRAPTHAGGQSGAVILPGERIILQNDPTLLPPNIQADWSTNKINGYAVQSAGDNLDAAIGNELVLLRPRVTPAGTTPPPGGTTPPPTPPSNSAPENTYNEAFLTDLVPLDNLDLAGVAPSTAQPPQPRRFRYARANKLWADLPPQGGTPVYPPGYPGAAWHCVYPGPYNRANPIHHTGLVEVLAVDIPVPNSKPISADNGNFGRPIGLFQTTPTPTSGNVQLKTNGSMLAADATFETRPLKINGLDQAGPNRPYAESPVGGAAEWERGAVAQPNGIPGRRLPPSGRPPGSSIHRFICHPAPPPGPIIGTPDPSASGANVYEMNSVTMDSVLAQFQPPSTIAPTTSYDQDTFYGPANTPLAFHNEQIGHFRPMTVLQSIPGQANLSGSDFTDDPSDPNFFQYQKAWTYHWAKRLFDYLDVFTPQDAYLPNVDPAVTSANASGDPSIPGSSLKYPGAAATPLPVPISGSSLLPVKPLTGQPLVQQLQGLQETARLGGPD